MPSWEMATVTDVQRSLQALGSDEIVSILCRLIQQRPELSAAVLSHLQQTVPSPSSQDAPDYAGSPLRGLAQLSPPAAALLSAGGASVLPDPESVFGLQRSVAHMSERWAIAFLFLFNGVMLVTVAVSYTMSIGSGSVSRSHFFISNSIDTGWPHRIGALGISIAFIAYLFAMFVRFLAVKRSLMDPLSSSVARSILWLNRGALIASFCAAFGALGVGAFNQSFNYAVHMTFAADTFGAAAVSILLHSCIDELICFYSVPGHPTPAIRWRICRAILCISSFTGLVGMFYSGANGYVEASCIYELIMATALFSYYATWVFGQGYIVGVKVFLEEKSMRSLQSFSAVSARSYPSTE